MKVVLINPSCSKTSGRDLYSANLVGSLLTFQPNKRMALGMPLALTTLAAHTPPEHEIKIIDEEIEKIDFNEPADIVGLTAMTFKATRAYEIAREYRSRGVKVVMGGIHATVCPDEVAQHVDCVVIGEADHIWPALLTDADAGKLKSRYAASDLPSLDSSRPPRYDLVKNDQYLYTYLQTTRGCPHDCTFCTVTKVSGRKIRKKTADQVIKEVESIIAITDKNILHFVDRSGRKRKYLRNIAFIDDNFAIDRKHALTVCSALKQCQDEHAVVIPWYTQVNVEVGFDEELLTAMEDSNCSHLFIGFESLDPETLQSMKKGINSPEKYGEAIGNIQRHGIRVIFSTIIGDENTSQRSCDFLESFLKKNNVFHVLLNILTPYPGTALAEKMKQEGRILTQNPELYNIRNVVFKPNNMPPKELTGLFTTLCRRIYNYDSQFKRGKPLLETTGQLRFPLFERFIILIGLFVTCLRMVLSSQLKLTIAIKMLLSAPYLILCCGTLYAFELMITSADFDDFADNEAKRLA